MNFTDEHRVILEQHRHLYDCLTTAGYMRNIDRPVFDALQKVHNEALEPAQYLPWCGECVADMVRILYTNYDRWLEAAGRPQFEGGKRKRRKY